LLLVELEHCQTIATYVFEQYFHKLGIEKRN